jgi:mannosyltransferase
MAVARPIRLLGALCILLVIVVVFYVSHPAQSLISVGTRLKDGMKRDPLLDRTFGSQPGLIVCVHADVL